MSLDCIDTNLFDIKIYEIPFRPEYLLIEGPDQSEGAWNRWGLLPSAAPTGRDVKAFRFHLAPEAVALLIQQDPTVTYVMGFHSLTIKFDACKGRNAMIEVVRAVYKKSVADRYRESGVYV